MILDLLPDGIAGAVRTGGFLLIYSITTQRGCRASQRFTRREV
jgi:hypothetical protein